MQVHKRKNKHIWEWSSTLQIKLRLDIQMQSRAFNFRLQPCATSVCLYMCYFSNFSMPTIASPILAAFQLDALQWSSGSKSLGSVIDRGLVAFYHGFQSQWFRHGVLPTFGPQVSEGEVFLFRSKAIQRREMFVCFLSWSISICFG